MDHVLVREVVTTIIKKGTQLTEAINEVLKKEGLTIQQFNVLRILRGRKGKPARLSDVSSLMIHPNSNTTRVIDKLIDKKLVDRKQSKTDRRKIDITITKYGLDILQQLDQPITDRESQLMQQLNNADLKIMKEYLNNI